MKGREKERDRRKKTGGRKRRRDGGVGDREGDGWESERGKPKRNRRKQ